MGHDALGWTLTKDATLYNTWSAQRLALAVLDANGGPMRPEDAVAAVARRPQWSTLRVDSPSLSIISSPVRTDADGRWSIDRAIAPLAAVQSAVREKIATQRRYAADRTDPAAIEARRREREALAAARAAEAAALRRVIVYGYPPSRPEALALLDVEARTITTLLGDEVATARTRLAEYDVVAALDVRPLLRALGVEPEGRRLAELGPPQKTMKINQRGRILKITTDLLIHGTCGSAAPSPPTR